ncbi:MAG: hypothetical protein O7B79_01210, partial [SAR324 cluster bacterium]|nr:hypothetical protein [SAR324 cluster bacterium]
NITMDIHTHTVLPPDLTGGMDVTLALDLAFSHSHSVSLTATDLIMLSQCFSVTKTSTIGSSHTHQVTFTPF